VIPELLSFDLEPLAISRLIQVFMNAVSAISDHWYYLGRVGVYEWSSPAEEHFLSMLGTFSALASIAIDLINECLVIITKRHLQKDFCTKTYLRGKALWFTQKLLDIPVRLLMKRSFFPLTIIGVHILYRHDFIEQGNSALGQCDTHLHSVL
jgi:hypothetical protein